MSGADASAVGRFFARTGRRLAVLAALDGMAMGLAIGAMLALIGWPGRDTGVTPLAFGALAVAVGAAVRLVATRSKRTRVGLVAERAVPESRNLLVTAEELMAAAAVAESAAPTYAVAEVMRRAASLTETLDPGALFPLTRRAGVVAAAAVFWFASVARATDGSIAGRIASDTPMIDDVEVAIDPPAYTGRAPRVVRNPDRVEAIAGSRIAITVSSNADSVVVVTLDSTRVFGPDRGTQRFTVTVLVEADGFVALEPRSSRRAESGARDSQFVSGARRLTGVTALDDAAPRARIVAPARDLILPDGRQSIDVAIEADDDIAVASLRLRFTRVSGSGERFSFTDGEVPLTVTRVAPRMWRSRVRWTLDSLALEPGDMVVYRAAVTDGRPGAAVAESEAFIAEVAAPGGVAASGFAIDPDQERYALSQQMIVLKTERLLARRAALGAPEYADSAAEIASEQRRVRAEFVFMMGGDMSDGAVEEGNFTDLNEEAEAEAEADLLAGREANLGRLALRRATRSMSRAARLLTEVDVQGALAQARAAVVQLAAAFARNRIILRALTEREELDPARRLTGELTDAAPAPRSVVPAIVDQQVTALRDVLARVARLARAVSAGASSGAMGESAAHVRDATLGAERALRIDPSARPMQDAASALLAASTAMTRGDGSGAGRALDRAAILVGGELRRLLPVAGVGATALDGAATRGAVADLLRTARPR